MIREEGRCDGSNALTFGQVEDASASYVEIWLKTDINERESYTIMCWIKLKRYSTETEIILVDWALQKYMFTIIHGKPSLKNRVSGKNLWRMKTAHERIRLHCWIHAAATWDGDNIALYVNGQEIDGKISDVLAENKRSSESGTAYVGGHPSFEKSYQFQGSVMDLFVIGTVLSRDTIRSIFRGDFLTNN